MEINASVYFTNIGKSVAASVNGLLSFDENKGPSSVWIFFVLVVIF